MAWTKRNGSRLLDYVKVLYGKVALVAWTEVRNAARQDATRRDFVDNSVPYDKIPHG